LERAAGVGAGGRRMEHAGRAAPGRGRRRRPPLNARHASPARRPRRHPQRVTRRVTRGHPPRDMCSGRPWSPAPAPPPRGAPCRAGRRGTFFLRGGGGWKGRQEGEKKARGGGRVKRKRRARREGCRRAGQLRLGAGGRCGRDRRPRRRTTCSRAARPPSPSSRSWGRRERGAGRQVGTAASGAASASRVGRKAAAQHAAKQRAVQIRLHRFCRIALEAAPTCAPRSTPFRASRCRWPPPSRHRRRRRSR
jgi:hypothetical protein